MPKHSLKDGAETFDITVLEAPEPSRVVLFAVGGGGDPGRHLPLLLYLAACGCTVVAPHCERLMSASVSEGDLLSRARRLRLALDAFALPGLLVAGVGHSIGTTMLLALAGGQAWMRAGQCLPIATSLSWPLPPGTFRRLVLWTEWPRRFSPGPVAMTP